MDFLSTIASFVFVISMTGCYAILTTFTRFAIDVLADVKASSVQSLAVTYKK